MVLVLQFIVFNEHNIYNPNNNQIEKASFIDLILGDYYKKADKSRKDKIEKYDKLLAGKDISVAAISNDMGKTENPSLDSSLYGSGDSVYYVAGLQGAVGSEQNPFTYGALDTRNTGGATSSISFPSFIFFGENFGSSTMDSRQNIAAAAVRDIVRYQPVSSDLEVAFKDMLQGRTVDEALGLFGLFECSWVSSNNTYSCKNALGTNVPVPLDSNNMPDFDSMSPTDFKLPIDLIAENLKQLKQQEARYKLLFIQSLFIILITLAITISFMHTVMELGGKLAGASATPIGKASSVYQILASKLKNSAMKTG
jgi:hypothetical protein